MFGSQLIIVLKRCAVALETLAHEAEVQSSLEHQMVALFQRWTNVFESLVPKPAVGVRFLFHLKGASMGEITVADDEQTLTSTLSFLDAEGHPTTPPDGVVPAYESSDETVAVVTASADGITATYEIGAPGDAVITATGLGVTDADGNEVVGKGTIHVTPGGIAVADIQFTTGG